MALVEVKVPDIGDFKDVAIIELLVKPGDTIKAEQSLLTVESDKASMEIPSSHAGVVEELRAKIGDKISEGTVIAVIETSDTANPPPQAGEGRVGAAAAPTPSSPAQTPPPQPSPASGGGSVEVKVPDIGDFKDVAVIELLVKPGDTVKVEQSLITVESDKASMEIPSSAAGTVKELKVKLGDKVKEGSLLVVLEGAATDSTAGAAIAPPAPAPQVHTDVASQKPPSPAPSTASAGPVEVHVPDIGDFKDVAVIELLVKPGDSV